MVGAVVFSFSFVPTEHPFLRDVIFYVIAVYCAFFVVWDHKIYWWEAAGVCLKLGVVLLDHHSPPSLLALGPAL